MKEDHRTESDDSLTDRTAKGLMWALSGSGLQSILRLASVAALARLLSPEDFGVWGAAGTVIAFAMAFSEMGLGRAVVQRPTITDRAISSATWASAVLGILLGVVIAALAPLVGRFFGFAGLEDVLRVVAILFPLEGLAAVPRAVLERELQFKRLSIAESVAYLAGYIGVALAAGAAGWGVWALVAASLTNTAVAAALLVGMTRAHLRPVFHLADLRSLAGVSGGFAVGKLMNFIALQGDFIVAGRMLGAEALGLYNRAYKLIAFPVNLFALALEKVLLPSVAEVQHDAARVRTALRRGAVLMAFGFLPISLVGLALAEEIVAVVLGQQWSSAVVPFQILAVGAFFRSGYKVGDAVSGALGAVYRRAARHGIYAALVVGGSVVGATIAGLEGLAIGVLAALIVQFLMMAQLSVRLTGIGWRPYLSAFVAPMGWTLFVGLSLAGASAGLRQLDMPDLVVLLGSLVIMAVTGLIAYRLRPSLLGADGRWLVERALKVIRRA